MYDRTNLVEQTDPELWKAILAENARQEHHIELIASENYASPAVMAAQGSQLGWGQAQQVLVLQGDRALPHRDRGWQQAHDGQCQHAFA